MSITNLINKSTFSETDKVKLLKSKNKIKTRLGVTDYKKDDLAFYESCRYVLEITKFEFKDAMNSLGVQSEEEFYRKYWFSNITINNSSGEQFTIGMNELFGICSSQNYIDSDAECSAMDFIHGDYSDSDVNMLLSLYKPVHVCVDIMSADQVREQQKLSRLDAEWRKIRDESFRLLDASVFNGIYSCNVFTSLTKDVELEFIREQFNELQFSVQFIEDTDEDDVSIGTNLVIMAQQSSGDFNVSYSEEQLLRMLESERTGGAYFFVATYCDKKIKPLIVRKCYEEVSARLKMVEPACNKLIIKKITTKTCAYAQVFVTLRSKGFKVYDSKEEFRIEW